MARDRRVWVAVVAAVSLVAAACGDDDTGALAPGTDDDVGVAEGDPVHGGSVVVALESETTGWLPGSDVLVNFPGQNVVHAIYDALMKRDENGELQPYLAESVEPNEDLTEWTLTLRDGVRFHDGTDLDAEALKANFDEHLKAEGSNLLGVLRTVAGMEVVDERTVRYVMAEPDAALPDILSGPAGLPFSPTAAAEMGADFASQPVGTGPFVFEDWQRDSRLRVSRNDDYWQDGLPYLDAITFVVITDEETRLASLVTEDVDAMQTLRQSTFRQVLEADGVVSHTHIGNLAGAQLFNTVQPPVDDPRIRRSLMYAIDQEAILEVLGGADISPLATQWFAPGSPWHSERVAEAWPTNDPDRARELLEEYVNDADRSDGRPVGAPVTLEHNIIPDPSVVEMGLAYKSMWEAVGYEHNMHQIEVATLITAAETGDYMINTSRLGSEDDPCVVLRNAFGPPETTPTNWTNFSHPELDEQLEILCTSIDFEERYDAAEAIMMLFTEQVPHTWTGHTPTVMGALPSLENIAGWTFPDGTMGDGHPNTVVMWGHVWLDA
jgi:peptide/nickel transport system substrate-binding protein